MGPKQKAETQKASKKRATKKRSERLMFLWWAGKSKKAQRVFRETKKEKKVGRPQIFTKREKNSPIHAFPLFLSVSLFFSETAGGSRQITQSKWNQQARSS